MGLFRSNDTKELTPVETVIVISAPRVGETPAGCRVSNNEIRHVKNKRYQAMNQRHCKTTFQTF